MRWFLKKKYHPIPLSVEDALLDMLFKGRYGNIKRCPSCWEKPSYHRVSGRKCYACSYCGYQLHPIGGTTMHKSATPISKWLLAYYLMATNPKITIESLQEYLGVTFKTAWRIRNQIRKELAQYMPYYRQQQKDQDDKS